MQEDLSVNEIESVLELFLEHVLAHDNAIEESDEQDFDSNGHSFSFTLFLEHAERLLRATPPTTSPALTRITVSHFATITPDIQSPPPKA